MSQATRSLANVAIGGTSGTFSTGQTVGLARANLSATNLTGFDGRIGVFPGGLQSGMGDNLSDLNSIYSRNGLLNNNATGSTLANPWRGAYYGNGYPNYLFPFDLSTAPYYAGYAYTTPWTNANPYNRPIPYLNPNIFGNVNPNSYQYNYPYANQYNYPRANCGTGSCGYR